MKLLIVGGNGTIGKKVTRYFSDKNEVIISGRTSGEVTVDISDSSSIKKMLEDKKKSLNDKKLVKK